MTYCSHGTTPVSSEVALGPEVKGSGEVSMAMSLYRTRSAGRLVDPDALPLDGTQPIRPTTDTCFSSCQTTGKRLHASSSPSRPAVPCWHLHAGQVMVMEPVSKGSEMAFGLNKPASVPISKIKQEGSRAEPVASLKTLAMLVAQERGSSKGIPAGFGQSHTHFHTYAAPAGICQAHACRTVADSAGLSVAW